MARPKKSKLPETEVEVSTPKVDINFISSASTEPTIVEEINVEPTTTDMQPPPVATSAGVQEPEITPEFDAREMSRYFCVINNSEAASRISPQITHQRELQLWGVHQYDNASKNSFARSFYFKELRNAQHALAAAQKLV